MAEVTVDAVCEHLGVDVAVHAPPTSCCRAPRTAHTHRVGDRLAARERNLHDEQVICECELVTRGMLLDAAAAPPDARAWTICAGRMRLGMGPCQGGFCIPRAAALLTGEGHMDASRRTRPCARSSRSGGRASGRSCSGRQARQGRLDDWLYHGALDIDHLPA